MADILIPKKPVRGNITYDQAIANALSALLIIDPPVIQAIAYNQITLLNTKEDIVLLIELGDEQFSPTGENQFQSITQVAEITIIFKPANLAIDSGKMQCAAIAGIVQNTILANPRLTNFLVCAGKFINAEHGQVMIKDKKAVYVCLYFQGKYFRRVVV